MLTYASQYRIELRLTFVIQGCGLPVLGFKARTHQLIIQQKGRIAGNHLFIATSKTLFLACRIGWRTKKSENFRQREQTVDVVIMTEEIGRERVRLGQSPVLG